MSELTCEETIEVPVKNRLAAFVRKHIKPVGTGFTLADAYVVYREIWCTVAGDPLGKSRFAHLLEEHGFVRRKGARIRYTCGQILCATRLEELRIEFQIHRGTKVVKAEIAKTEAPTWVYTLLDPASKEPRYVGCTQDPKQRLQLHVCTYNRDMPVSRWIFSIKPSRPIMCTVREFSSLKEGLTFEADLIVELRQAGHTLLNRQLRRPA
jgi:hypothetical protein